MELNQRRPYVEQVSSQLDDGIMLSVTEVGIEPTVLYYRGPRLPPPSSVGGRALLALDLVAFPVCVPGRQKQRMAGSGVAPDGQDL